MEQYGYREMPKQGLSPRPRLSLAGLAGNSQSYRSVFTPTLPLTPGPSEAGKR